MLTKKKMRKYERTKCVWINEINIVERFQCVNLYKKWLKKVTSEEI